MNRDVVPTEVKRAVLVEAGHRCAIPTCRATTTEIAHIVPQSERGQVLLSRFFIGSFHFEVPQIKSVM